jgi:predicted nucleic acid-binding protein
LKLLTGKSIHAPNLIDHEIISVAIKKEEANAKDVVRRGLDSFRKLRLARQSIDHRAHFELALRQKTTTYDAAYLQLAVLLNAPLATDDRVLASAASKVLSVR